MALYPRNNTSVVARDAGFPAGQPSSGTSASTGSTASGSGQRYELGAAYGAGGDYTPHTPMTDYNYIQNNGGVSAYDTIRKPGASGGNSGIPGATGTDGTENPSGTGGYTGGYYGGGSTGASSSPRYKAPTLRSATSQEDYINAMYDANRQAREDALRNAYEQQVNVLDDQANRLPGTYNAAADQVAAQAAIQQRNFNEQAAASGLNTGAGSQARLAQNNAYLGRISDVRRAQADAQADLDLQRTQLEAQYRNAIADAIAQNDLQRAQALYQEAVRVDESMVNTAINQANINWQVWNSLYNR